MSDSLREQVLVHLRGISAQAFEHFAFDLVQAIGFTNVVSRGVWTDADQGRDIEADYYRYLPDGRSSIPERWFFECKRQARNVSAADLADKIAWARAERADFFVLISPTVLTRGAREYVDKATSDRSPRFLAWTHLALADSALESHSLMARHFPDIMLPQATAYVEAEERLRLARGVLAGLGFIDNGNESVRTRLVTDVLSACIRSRDIETLRLMSLDNRAESIWLVSPGRDALGRDGDLALRLRLLLENDASMSAAWTLARHARQAEQLPEAKSSEFT